MRLLVGSFLLFSIVSTCLPASASAHRHRKHAGTTARKKSPPSAYSHDTITPEQIADRVRMYNHDLVQAENWSYKANESLQDAPEMAGSSGFGEGQKVQGELLQQAENRAAERIQGYADARLSYLKQAAVIIKPLLQQKFFRDKYVHQDHGIYIGENTNGVAGTGLDILGYIRLKD